MNKRVNISLPTELHEKIKAVLDGRPLSKLVTNLLATYLRQVNLLHTSASPDDWLQPKKYKGKLVPISKKEKENV